MPATGPPVSSHDLPSTTSIARVGSMAEPTDDVPGTDQEHDATDADEASYVAAYDIDGDGDVSPVEDARAALGIADAKLEQLAEEGGITGKIAEAAHHVVDKLDND